MNKLNLRETLLRTRTDKDKPMTQNELAEGISSFTDIIISQQYVNYWVTKSISPVWIFVLKQYFKEKGFEVVES